MKSKSIPSVENLTAHEQAAEKITSLRRKGIPCHLEDHPDRHGHHLEIVRDEKTDPDLPPITGGR
ncbi:MAG: hypothetical protein QM755_03410 [Luteolibacter sp.]